MQRQAIHILIAVVAGLVTLGLVMLYSTSAFAQESHGDPHAFIKKQTMWLCIGIAAAAVLAMVDYNLLVRFWRPVFGISMVLLILCFIPPFGQRINGSSRWINAGFTNFQPSELAKLAAILFLAHWVSIKGTAVQSLREGFLMPMAVLSLLLVPILLEVDIGNTALIGATALVVLFCAGLALRWFSTLVVAGLGGILFLGTQVDERQGRLLAFMNPEKYRLCEGLQQWQALIAFGSGGVDGLGLGEGRQKMLYLPYAHTDFIFPMIGEECGMYITLLTVFGFLVVCICGCMVAVEAKDRSGFALAIGAVFLITIQAMVNIGVTTSLLPNKGMPLPFISYGGSNLVLCLSLVGLLINIHRQGRQPSSSLAPTILRPATEAPA